MKYQELIEYFGTPAAAAKALDIDRQVVFGWKKRNSIPLEQQIEAELKTAGALRADVPDAIRENAA